MKPKLTIATAAALTLLALAETKARPDSVSPWDKGRMSTRHVIMDFVPSTMSVSVTATASGTVNPGLTFTFHGDSNVDPVISGVTYRAFSGWTISLTLWGGNDGASLNPTILTQCAQLASTMALSGTQRRFRLDIVTPNSPFYVNQADNGLGFFLTPGPFNTSVSGLQSINLSGNGTISCTLL